MVPDQLQVACYTCIILLLLNIRSLLDLLTL